MDGSTTTVNGSMTSVWVSGQTMISSRDPMDRT